MQYGSPICIHIYRLISHTSIVLHVLLHRTRHDRISFHARDDNVIQYTCYVERRERKLPNTPNNFVSQDLVSFFFPSIIFVF